jgi:hypothetical protein
MCVEGMDTVDVSRNDAGFPQDSEMVRQRGFRFADRKMSAGKGIHDPELPPEVEPDGIAQGVELG